VTEGSDPDQFWATLVVRLLHPIQIQIIEAMLWIDYPLSASALVKVFGGKIRPSTVAYHVLRLNSLRALRKVGKREPLRGSPEKLYRVRLS
jgi:hypothetical protein